VVESSDWYKYLLEAITAVQSQMVGEFRRQSLFEGLLASLLKLTRSEYGFIGEVFTDDKGAPFLRTHAITNIAWNEETERFYEDNVRSGLEFRNLTSLFGAVLTTEKPVLANDPATDSRRGGLPKGHPPLNKFLGLPLRSAGAIVGMVGLANRPEGYNEELLQALEPLTQTCANAVFASRADAQEKVGKKRIEEQQAQLRGVLDSVFDGVVSIDERGILKSVNRAAEQMFGWTNDEILGRNISILMPVPFQSQHDGLLKRYIDTGQPDILGYERQLPACRKNGEIFTIELRLAEVCIEETRLFTGIIRDLSKQDEAERKVDILQAELARSRYGQMIGKSAPMQRLYRMIEEVSVGDWPVLIEGETGVGKELVARAIHAAGPRSNQPFIPTNTAGLTDALVASQLFGHRRGAFTGAERDQKGLFETAEGGTLFLDEIGDVSEAVQTSLLRVLEEKEITRVGDSLPRKVDVRIICATNGSLRERLASGHFRKDFLYRLQVARIEVPALRERRDDIPLLIEAFLAKARAMTGKSLTGLTPDAMQRMLSYVWPGNIRELRNAIDYVAIHSKGPLAQSRDLPPELVKTPAIQPGGSSSPISQDDERANLIAALKENDGVRARAARTLGISRATLYRKLAAFGIQ
jgi:PAS domain S-box-containing protein